MTFDDQMPSDSFLEEADRRELEQEQCILEGDNEEYNDWLDEIEGVEIDEDVVIDHIQPVPIPYYIDAEVIEPPFMEEL